MPTRALPTVLLLLLHTVLSYKFIGCFLDKFDVQQRDLAGSLFLDDSLTIDKCEQQCAEDGFNVFGLQYGNECWCGESTTYGRYGKADSTDCSMPCGGDQNSLCGGPLRNSVYQITIPIKSPDSKTSAGGSPLIALVMIVKDEAHTLGNTLGSIKPFIDSYYILDTGSTDGTQNVIRKALDGVPGKIFQEPFVDYGTSRNRILDLAAEQDPQPVFTFMLSADETVYNGHALRKFAEEHQNSRGIQQNAYSIVMNSGWKFDSVRLARVSGMWRYRGKVHEYLAPPKGKKAMKKIRIPDAYIKFKVTDPERRHEREYKIIDILEEEMRNNPKDARSSFYLARSYNSVKNHSAALKEFQRRVEIGGWREEVYESLYAIAWQKKQLHYDWEYVQQAFLEAHNYSPHRAEPLFFIADHYYKNKDYHLAYIYLQRAFQLPLPKKDVLWVNGDIYKWKAAFRFATCAFHISEIEAGMFALFQAKKGAPDEKKLDSLWTSYSENVANLEMLFFEWSADTAESESTSIESPKIVNSEVWQDWKIVLLAAILCGGFVAISYRTMCRHKHVRGFGTDLIDKTV